MSRNTGKTYRVGSRDSPLALLQTNLVINQLQNFYPEHAFEIIAIKTIGDKILDRALTGIGSKALFTKELEVALLERQIDFAVHSLKDLPTTLPEGLVVTAITEREDPRDAVIGKFDTSQEPFSLSGIPDGSLIGTGSPRRIAQLRFKYPHLRCTDIRGNLNTRLKKLDDPNSPYAAIILAAAGIHRMGWQDRISLYLDGKDWKYAVGQGALAVECAESNLEITKLFEPISHPETYLMCLAERNFLRTLEGGCAVPVGVVTRIYNSVLHISGSVYTKDASRSIHVEKSLDLLNSVVDDIVKSDLTSVMSREFSSYPANACLAAAQLGSRLGDKALKKGAKEILSLERTHNGKQLIREGYAGS